MYVCTQEEGVATVEDGYGLVVCLRAGAHYGWVERLALLV